MRVHQSKDQQQKEHQMGNVSRLKIAKPAVGRTPVAARIEAVTAGVETADPRRRALERLRDL
ncbi:MAG TPA: hypothetical protein VNQ74_11600, partial [Burkholderiaceae bacterium]|nr:hypothetical protein [Burkholderiaceae bacterium]